MKILIILNGISRRRNNFLAKTYADLRKEFECDLEITQYAGHAEELAKVSNHDIILAAGGDGTMSQVVNGVMNSSYQPAIGLIPLGSGNDLARTLKVKDSIITLIKKNKPRLVDVGVATFSDHKRYFINECSIGMGPEVVRRIERSRRPGASLTYMKAIISTFLTHKPQTIHIKTDGLEWEGDARVLAVANGKAFGHSIYIAPDAEMDDGRLNMFLCKGIPLVKFLLYLQAIKTPKKINDRKWLDYRMIDHIEVRSSQILPVEADGELIGFTPLICGVRQKSIKILA